MAAYITQKERLRRIILLVFLSIFALGLAISGWYYIDRCEKLEMGKEEVAEGEDESVKKSIKDFETALREQEDIYEKREAAVVDFSEPIGWRTRASSTGDRYNHTLVYVRKIKEYMDEWVKTLMKGYRTRNETKAVNKYELWESAKEEGVFMHIVDLFEELARLHTEMKTLEKKAEEEKNKFLAEEKETIKRTDDERKKRREAIEGDGKTPGGIILDIITQLDNIVKTLKERDQQIAEQEDIFRNKSRELINIKKAQMVDQLKRNAEVEVYRKKKEEVHKEHDIDLETENEKMEPDAKVIYADNEGQVLWVSFTWRDRVFPGMEFPVYGVNRGGEKFAKGRAKLIEIGDTMSKALIETDRGVRYAPVAIGDFLIEPRYINTTKNTFAFAGKLVGRFALEELLHRLETKGDIHHPKLGTKTIFLVCGDQYESDPNYKAMEGLPIRTIRERDLYAYLGIEW